MKRAITMVTRLASDDDGTGDGGKSNGESNKRAMAAATTVAAMRVASNKEDEGVGQATMRAMEAAAMTVAVMRVVSDKEGEGSDGDRDKVGGRAMVTATKRAVAMAMRVAGKDAMANGSTMVMFFFSVGS